MYAKDAILYARGDWPRVLYNIYNMHNVYNVCNIYKYVIKKGGFFAFPFLFAIVLRESRGCSERSERNASGVAKPPCAEQVSVSIIYIIYMFCWTHFRYAQDAPCSPYGRQLASFATPSTLRCSLPTVLTRIFCYAFPAFFQGRVSRENITDWPPPRQSKSFIPKV